MQLFSQHNIHSYLTTVIHATSLSCITRRLNIIKYITKQYHEMTIEYLYFICFVGRLHLLYHLLHWRNHHFLSKWQELSSSYSSSLEGYSLNGERLIFNCSHLLLLWIMSQAESNYFLLAYILCVNPMILGGHSQCLLLLRLLHHSIRHLLLVSSRMTH